MAETIEAPERKRDYSRLTRDEIASIFTLHRAGKTQVEIAETLNCNVSSVCRWLKSLDDTTDLAKQILKSSAADVARALVKTKHAPTQLEILRDQGVSEKKAPAGETRTGVTVLIGVHETEVKLGVQVTQAS